MHIIILYALMIALVVNLGVSALIAGSYRSAVRRLMGMAPLISHPAVGSDRAQPAELQISRHGEGQELPSPAVLKEREHRLWRILCGLSTILGLICSLAWLVSMGAGWKPLAWMLCGLVMATPGLLLQMELMRWSLGRQALLAVAWVGALGILFSLAGIDLGMALALILPMVVIPFVLFQILFGIPELRGIAPFLLAPVFIIVWLALLGQELLAGMLGSWGGAGLGWLVGAIGAVGVFLLFSLLPAAAGGVSLAHRLSRVLGGMYRRKSYSDLIYLYGSSWLVITLIFTALNWQSSPGVVALLPLLGWGIIPAIFSHFGPDWLRIPHKQTPLLLVLRVFGFPERSGWLFDHVVQRWRFIGPVALISGTDLARRTVEPHLLVGFLEGQLQRSYIHDENAVREALAELDSDQDLDGRHRIGEFFCYASTWQRALMDLMQQASCVLMDLRGFGPPHKGCQFELEQLAANQKLENVVILVDRTTDTGLIQTIVGNGNQHTRIHLISADGERLQKPSAVLLQLLA